jgi:hypothetical protein
LRRRRRNGWNAVSSAAGQHQAAHFLALVVDRVERLGKAAEHVERHRVHDFLVVEFQDGDVAVQLQRDVLELHGFLFWFWPASLAARWL